MCDSGSKLRGTLDAAAVIVDALALREASKCRERFRGSEGD